jgi:hypothetical protein
MIGAMASDPQALSLSIRPLARLAQDEERRCTGSEAGRGRGMGEKEMAVKTRTHFAYRIDIWSKPKRDSLVEYIAGVEDYHVALATYRAAVERWPGTPISLRQGTRVIEDSQRLRLAWSDQGRQGGR